jgi:hypothetical protein
MDDRRRDPRLAASWPSSIVTDDAILVGRTVDVSEYGLCVVTAPTTAVKAGHSYRIELVGSSGTAISTVAEVRHVSAQRIGLRTRDRLPSAGVVVGPRPANSS